MRSTTSRRKAVPAVVAAMVTALVLAACTQGTDPVPDPPSTPSPTASSSGEPSSPGPTGGSAAGRPIEEALGAKWDWGRVDSFSSYLEDLRGSSTFYELVWCDIEPQEGQRDWSSVDKVASKAEALGVELMLKIRVGRCWVTDGEAKKERGQGKTESAPPRDMDAYSAMVREAVARYAARGVSVYAMENEPNSEGFWDGTPDQAYDLAVAASKAIRAADPDATVVDMGVSSTAYGAGVAQWLLAADRDQEAVDYWNAYYERRFATRGGQLKEMGSADELKDYLGSGQPRRNLDYLELAERLAKEGVVDVRQIHFYEPSGVVPVLMDYLRDTTAEGVSIEAWEVGQFLRGSSLPEEQSTDEMVRTTSLLLAGGAQTVLWLPLIFNPDGRNPDEPRTSLLEGNSGEVRPIGTAYAAMASDARGAEVVAVDQGKVQGVSFERDGTTTAYLWTTGDTVNLTASSATAAPPTDPEQSSAAKSLGTTPTRVSVQGSLSTLLPGE